MKNSNKTSAFVFLPILSLLAFAAGATEISVSLTGLSPHGAMAKIRAAKAAGDASAWTVRVAPGLYEFREPLTFRPEDSGTPSAPIRWIADGGEAVFAGGGRLGGWRDDGDGTWSAPLPKDAAGQPVWFQSLFVNGRRAARARHPSTGYFHVDAWRQESVTNAAGEVSFVQYAVVSNAAANALTGLSPPELAAVELQAVVKWSYGAFAVTGWNPQTRELTVDSRREKVAAWKTWPGTSNLFRFENVRAGFDAPGEWFCDVTAGRVRYRPLPGETLEKLEALAPTAQLVSVVRFEGDPAAGKSVTDISFEGISFALSRTDGDRLKTGFVQQYQLQAARDSGGCIYAKGSRRIAFVRCRVSKTENYAIRFDIGCVSNRVVGCELTDLGAGGVWVGDTRSNYFARKGLNARVDFPGRPVPYGDPKTAAFHPCAFFTIDDCEIAHTGKVNPEGCGIVLTHVSDSSVTHCDIHDLTYTGVSVGWTWGYSGSLAQRNTIAFNRIRDVGQGVMSDMGGIYTLGTSFGTCISNNVVSAIKAYSYGGWALYNDEGSEGIVWENNLVYDAASEGYHQHYGRNNVLRNNIIACAKANQLCITLAERHLSFTAERNIVYWDEGSNPFRDAGSRYSYENGVEIWKDIKPTGLPLAEVVWKDNLFWCSSGMTTFGCPLTGTVADPLFVDAKARDFRLKPGSPALKLGFKPWDISRAGRRKTVPATGAWAATFVPVKGKASWRDGEATWSVGRQETKNPAAGAAVKPVAWGGGTTLTTKCADRSPHASPSAAVDFAAPAGRYRILAKGVLRNQIPLAGYGRAEWTVIRGGSGRVHRFGEFRTPMGAKKGVLNVEVDATVELQAGDVIRLRVQTVNPGPAGADNTWFSINEYRIETAAADAKLAELEKLPMPPIKSVGPSPYAGAVGDAIRIAKEGPVLPEDVADSIFESFETAEPRYVFRKMRGHPEAKVEERDGIGTHGSRSLHVDLAPTKDPDPKGYHESGIFWEFAEPRDLSMFDGVVMKLRAANENGYGMNLILTDRDGALWSRSFSLAGDKPNVWQTVSMPNSYGKYHEGPAARTNRCDLTQVKGIRIRLMGFQQKPVSFDIDEIGFVRKRAVYDGISVRNFAGKTRLGPKDGTFSFTAQIGGREMEEDVRAVFAAIDYFGKTNVLGELKIPAGVTSASVPLAFPNPGACFGRVVGVIYDSRGNPLHRKSRGYSSVRGLHEEDKGRNPNSIFGIWVGGGAPFEVGAKWNRTYVRAPELGKDGSIVETPRARPLRTYPSACDMPCVYSYMPRWLSVKGPDCNDGRYPAKDWKAYEKYISWVTQATPGFTLYEMWNEPVPCAYWMGTVDDLVKLAEATYRGMKAVRPEAKLLGPCPYSFLLPFMEEFFQKGGNKWIDDVVIHTYSAMPPDVHFVKGLRDTRALMRKYGLGDRDLYITEMGYSSPPCTPGEDDTAAFIPRCYAYAWREGVKFMIWHNLEALSHGSVSYDLIWKDKTPRPAYVSYCVMTRELEGAKLLREIGGLPAAAVAFEFERRGVKTILFWDKEASRGAKGTELSFDVPAGCRPVLVDLMGGETALEPKDGRVTVCALRDAAYLRFE